MRHVLLFEDEDPIRTPEIHSPPGCVSDGNTREDAINNIRDAIDVGTGFTQEQGGNVPPEHANLQLVDLETKHISD